MKSRLEALETIPLTDAVWSLAFLAGYEIRRMGMNIPIINILIASTAKTHNCDLLHHDKHFRFLASHLHLKASDFIDD